MSPTLSSNRRSFLKAAGLTSLSFMLPGMQSAAVPIPTISGGAKKFPLVNFTTDGLNYTPEEYLAILLEMSQSAPIGADYYAQGGVTAELELAFAALTGKEKAVFLPTGTMANEVAIKLLAGDKAKIVVPENSHIYRDEADASQAIHNKRLLPAGKGKPYFDVADLDRVIEYHRQGEVFPSPVGAVSVECPVRRADGVAVPIETIEAISTYCRDKGYGLHLDGARLHLASAWTGIAIHEYASFFDTVYISQYKYLNAAFGAVLCGPAELIDKFPMQAKLYGGAVFQTWPAAAMALFHLKTISDDLALAKGAGDKLIPRINAIEGLSITPVAEGTNVYNLITASGIDQKTLIDSLFQDHHIFLRPAAENGPISFKVNASILRRPLEELSAAWQEASEKARQ